MRNGSELVFECGSISAGHPVYGSAPVGVGAPVPGPNPRFRFNRKEGFVEPIFPQAPCAQQPSTWQMRTCLALAILQWRDPSELTCELAVMALKGATVEQLAAYEKAAAA